MRLVALIFWLMLGAAFDFGQAKCPDRPTPRDRPLQIIEKPKPSYPDGQTDSQGTVTLRVEFLSDGKIGRINVIKGLPHGITEMAIQAARQIKFKPEVKNCYAVDIVRPVSYAFQRY